MLIPCFDGYVQSSLFLAVLVSNIIVSTALEYVIKLPLPNLATFVISVFLNQHPIKKSHICCSVKFNASCSGRQQFVCVTCSLC